MLAKLIALLVVAFAVSPAFSASSAETQRDQLRVEINRLVADRKYAEITRQAGDALTRGTRLADGMWRLSWLYGDFWGAMQQQMGDDQAWENALEQIAKVAVDDPTAWLLYEQTLSARAWSVRGSGFGYEVPPEDMRIFKKYLVQARALMDKKKSQLASSPAWFSMRITLSLELGEEAGFSKRLFNEARRRHPGYHAIYFSRMRQLSPNWRGSKVKMLELLDEVSAMGGPAEKEGLYARLLWFADDTGYPLIHEETISASALRGSFDALASSYPDQWNVQKLFLMACERSDKQYAKKLLARVEGPPLPNLWKENLPLNALCTDWAQDRIPMFLMRDHEGGRVVERLIQ